VLTAVPGLYAVTVNNQTGLGVNSQCVLNIRGQSSLAIMIAFTQDIGVDHGSHSDQTSLYPTTGCNLVIYKFV
jgi:hypothetical protein